VLAKGFIFAGAASAALLSLSACNRSQANAGRHDPSAVASGSGASGNADTYAGADQGGYRHGAGGYGGGYRRQEAREPTPLFHGEPMWSENRSHTAKENAEYQFQRSGADIGAKTLDDFLTKAHRFGDHPPPGTLHIERSNGDRLLYDPKDNLFAVITRDGAPRTIFKPRDGMDYWNTQKAREMARGEGADTGERRGSSRRYGGRDGEDRSSYRDDRADRGQ
jgi:hypothetical protein